MKFSLIVVTEWHGTLVSGNWIQDHIGSLSSAIAVARATEATNGNKITVAVVDEIPGVCKILSYWTDLTRLDLDP
jgi:hypothetical protein